MKNGRIRQLAAALLGLLAALAPIAASAEETVGIGAIYTAENPVPGVWARVSPAVVQVRAIAETWSPETGASTKVKGRASGVYIDARGYVATSWHAVMDADSVEVETNDGELVGVTRVISDSSIDLAVLELEKALDGVTPPEPGDSDALVPGELAIIIGHPTSLSGVYAASVTAGIISGLNRSSEELGLFSRRVPLIQTDAQLNGGLTGGALLNARGELVGLVTLPMMEDEAGATAYLGPGFAMPVRLVMSAAAELIDHGVVRRPRMGVMVLDVDGPETAIRAFPPCGSLISEIEKGGPADRAGLMQYDIITDIDGERVHDFTELSVVLDSLSAGDTIHIRAYRCYDSEGYMIDNPAYVEVDLTLEILD